MSSSPLSWSLVSKVKPLSNPECCDNLVVHQLVDDTFPRIPTDLTIHLVEEEGEWEEDFQVVREPVQVRAELSKQWLRCDDGLNITVITFRLQRTGWCLP